MMQRTLRARPGAWLLPLFLLVTAASACQESAPREGQATAAAARYPAPTTFLVEDGRTFTLERRDGYGYTLRDPSGAKAGKVKVEADRVKVKDASDALVAKVKDKAGSFKLYDGADRVLLKGKRKGDELRLKNDAGNDVARLPWGDVRALDNVGGITAHQRLALAVFLADVEGR